MSGTFVLYILSPEGKQWTFPCGKWFSKDRDDKLIERELFPQAAVGQSYQNCTSASH